MSGPILHHRHVIPSTPRSRAFERLGDHCRSLVGRYFPTSDSLNYYYRRAQWYGKTIWLVAHSSAVHMKTLLSKTEFSVEFGSFYEQAANGRVVPNNRTHSRMKDTDNLLKKYPWASLLEEAIFLEGFDRGAAFALDTLDKSEKLASALSYPHTSEERNAGQGQA